MADYWKSQARKFCDFCKCWIADNKPSIDFHENGKRHKENVSKRLKEIHKNSAKQAKLQKKFESDIESMEKAAMAAYLKDVQSNTRDLTADKIIEEKWNKPKESKEKEEPDDSNWAPYADPETNPRHERSSYSHTYSAADIDPLDPFAKQKLARLEARQAKSEKKAAKNQKKAEEQGTSDKGKGRGKKSQSDESESKPPVRKVWYEARSQGYSYYWNIDTNESVWEPPAEGFMSLEEQAEEAKEEEVQKEFLKQIDKEQAKEKEAVLEEQRANLERERLKEVRKQFLEKRKAETATEDKDTDEEEEEEKVPYMRDYSVPEKPQPYGSWQTVKTVKTVDLQLPKVEKPVVPTVKVEKPAPIRVFKEKTITRISTGDSDDEAREAVSFKKRKFGNRSVRQRLDD